MFKRLKQNKFHIRFAFLLKKKKLLPVLSASFIFFIFIFVAQFLKKSEIKNLKEVINSESQLLGQFLTASLSKDILAFQRLSFRMSDEKKLDQSFWLKDVSSYYQHFGYYQEFAWMRPGGRIKWLYSPQKDIIDLNVNSFQKESLSKHTQVLREVVLASGKKKLTFWSSVYIRQKYQGELIGIIDSQKFFKKVSGSILKDNYFLSKFVYKVENQNDLIYASPNLNLASNRYWQITNTSTADLGVDWKIQISPTQSYVDSMLSIWSDAIVIIGFFLSLIMGLMIFYYQRSQDLIVFSEENLREQEVINQILGISTAVDTNLKTKLSQSLDLIISVPWLGVLSKGGIFLTKSNEELELFVTKNLETQIKRLCATVKKGECLCGRAFLSGKTVHASRVDDRHEVLFEGMEPHGHYNVPIRYKDKVLGVIVLYLPSGHMENQREIQFLEACAEVLATMIRSYKYEEELIKSKESAESAEKAKSAFLANMSHEIRTPLNGILGLTDLLKDSTKDQDILKKLSVIRNCGDSLLKIINDVLDLSKIEAGKVTLSETPLNLKNFLREQISLYESLALKKDVVLSLFIPENTPEYFCIDELRLRQILGNLLSNAIKFTPSGFVEVNVPASERPSLENKYIELFFEVKDSGIGISASDRGKLFKDFSQVDVSTTRNFGGTGLGLSITKNLVEIMGGTIWVESTLSRGSTFHFTILCKKMNQDELSGFNIDVDLQRDKSLSFIKPDLIKKNILIVDDNEINRIVAQGFLEKLGHKVDLAKDGFEALHAVSINEYDIIFMDCHMPQLDGFETTRRIATLRGKHPYIVALTASVMKSDIEKCFQAGMDDFLPKPITFESLEKVFEKENVKNLGYLNKNKVSNKFSIDNLLKHFQNDHQLLKSSLQLFLNQYDDMVFDIRYFFDKKQYLQLKENIHKLKGIVSNFHVKELVFLCQKLEAQIEILSEGSHLEESELDKNFNELMEQIQNLKITFENYINKKEVA